MSVHSPEIDKPFERDPRAHSKTDFGVDSDIDSGVDSGIDSGIGSGIGSGIDSGTRSGIASRVDGAKRRRAPFPQWAWALAGASIGLFDFGVLLAFDANLTIAGRDFTIPMFLSFLLPYSALGWLIGGLAVARARAERDRETIERQLATLERTQRALVQEEKLAGIGRLAAGVAHEVRNPLGVIRASASMARESFESNTDPHRALGFVCEETDRLDRLIQGLLTFAKPQVFERVPTDLTKLVDRAVELTRAEARDAGVALDVEIAPGLPSVRVDPDGLSQALYGLALNAVQAFPSTDEPDADRHTDALPRRVSIRCHPERDRILLDVADSGPGVADALRDEIFEPFVTTKQTGTGLGLPMALRLVEAMGGSLDLLAQGDRDQAALPGACFRISLPIDCAAGGTAS
jgi:signal transduction histidine kinase